MKLEWVSVTKNIMRKHICICVKCKFFNVTEVGGSPIQMLSFLLHPAFKATRRSSTCVSSERGFGVRGRGSGLPPCQWPPCRGRSSHSRPQMVGGPGHTSKQLAWEAYSAVLLLKVQFEVTLCNILKESGQIQKRDLESGPQKQEGAWEPGSLHGCTGGWATHRGCRCCCRCFAVCNQAATKCAANTASVYLSVVVWQNANMHTLEVMRPLGTPQITSKSNRRRPCPYSAPHPWCLYLWDIYVCHMHTWWLMMQVFVTKEESNTQLSL